MGIIDFNLKVQYYLIIVVIFISLILIHRLFNLSNPLFDFTSKNTYFKSTILEIIWTIIPGIILIIIAIPSLKLLYSIDEVWNPAITIKAIGNQWYWTYETLGPNGSSINFDSYTKLEEDLSFGEFRLLDVDYPLYLPYNTPIRLLVSAEDVMHSFFVPSFGIKIDAIPGRINHSNLFILREGTFYGQCTELCGIGHERMSIVIKSVPMSTYLNWILSYERDLNS